MQLSIVYQEYVIYNTNLNLEILLSSVQFPLQFIFTWAVQKRDKIKHDITVQFTGGGLKQPKIWLGFHLLRDIGWNSI